MNKHIYDIDGIKWGGIRVSQDATLTYIKDIALKLHDPKMFGGASLMVGAGFSKNAEGIGNRLVP